MRKFKRRAQATDQMQRDRGDDRGAAPPTETTCRKGTPHRASQSDPGDERPPRRGGSRESFGDDGDARDFRLGDLLAEARRHGGASFEISQSQYNEVQQRALSSSSSTVPTDFISQLTVYEREAAPMYSAATVTTRPVGRSVVFPRLTADVTAATTATAEGGNITLDDVTISSVTAPVFKLAVIEIVSNELMRDTGISNVESELTSSLGRALGYKANAWFTLGTATVEPAGIAFRATNGGTAVGTAFDSNLAGDNFCSWGDIVDLQGHVPANLLPRAAHMTSPAGLRAAMKWRDNTGAPIHVPNVTAGAATSAGPAGTLWLSGVGQLGHPCSGLGRHWLVLRRLQSLSDRRCRRPESGCVLGIPLRLGSVQHQSDPRGRGRAARRHRDRVPSGSGHVVRGDSATPLESEHEHSGLPSDLGSAASTLLRACGVARPGAVSRPVG